MVSSEGAIWSIRRNRHVKPIKGVGYYWVCLGRDNKKSIHTLVALAFIPNPEGKPWVNHKNRIRTDNHIDNLEWVTPYENTVHHYQTEVGSAGDFDYKLEWVREYSPKSIDHLSEIYGVEFRSINGHPHYLITADGRVWSLRRDRFLSRQTSASGYVMATLGASKTTRIHRLVAEAFIPNPQGLKVVNHIDGNKSNNNVSNLEWVTQAQNNRHAADNGLTARGSRNGMAKLTRTEVIEIREIYSSGGIILKDIAEAYGVSDTTVYRACFKLWGHLK